MSDVTRARELLSGKVTCALVKGEKAYVSEKSGVAPMLSFIAEGIDLSGFSAADKIVGKASAMLFVKAGVRAVYAEVLSVAGREFLENAGVEVSFGALTERIINRAGTGQCPMEKCVEYISDAEEGYTALKNKIISMRKQA
ncbi:MAG: DUF1893 domain-containing protein [Clostridia bacterium]|nr:DUF1893 domain-containing protein [Clostridia bacterium]